MTIIIYNEPDTNATCVVYPAPGVAIETVIASAVPQGATHMVMDEADLPDRYFRNAWTFDGASVDVDIEAAKEIQREHWRALRKSKMAALDLEFMRAIEQGLPTTDIAAAKNALRDVTDTPLTGTLDDIKNNIPAILL